MKAFIGLGSNLGEREATIRLALDDLARLPETTAGARLLALRHRAGRRGRPAATS